MQSDKGSNNFHIFAFDLTTPPDEKRKYAYMGTGRAFRTDDVRTVHNPPHRHPGLVRACTASVYGAYSKPAGQEKDMDIPLFCLRAVEHHHYLLGMQCNDRRRHICGSGQFTADVACIRPVQTQQEEIQRLTAIYFSCGSLDRLGKILFRCRDFLALARAGQFLRTYHLGNPMV